MSELEQCMIARNLLFMKLHQKPKSRMKGVTDRIVNVPVHESDIIETVKSLPRTPTEAGIIPVKLKRKKDFKNTHQEEYISVSKIKAALKTLKSLGHKYYQFIKEKDLEAYESRCQVLDEEGFQFLFGDSKCEEDILIDNIEDEIYNDLDDEDEKDLKNFLENDVVAKFQFDYNRNTCFNNNVPEISIQDQVVTVAPGEGKIPKDILQDKDWDMRAFPALDPKGENSLNCERNVKLSAQDFFQQRIMNINSRFAKCSSFVFAAVQYIENKQLTGNINISFQRGKATKRDDGGMAYTLDDACSVLDNIKNTPRFLKKKKNEFIAKLENNGPFQFFFTLSCADTRYEENFTSVLQDHDITYEVRDGREHCLIDGQNLEMFLKNNQSKHEFIRTNILTSTRNFDHRVKQFIKTVIMNKFNPMCVEFYNYRVEFQMHGAAHIHGVLWLDLDMFELKNPEFSGLKDAFEEIGNEGILSQSQEQIVAKFADKFITCTLKDPSTKQIVEEVNVHYHTCTCTSVGNQIVARTADFSFPCFQWMRC